MRNDALGQVMLEVNTLAETLRTQRPRRAGSHRAPSRGDGGDRRRDFAFDSDKRLVLVNRYGERLLGREGSDLIGQRPTTSVWSMCSAARPRFRI